MIDDLLPHSSRAPKRRVTARPHGTTSAKPNAVTPPGDVDPPFAELTPAQPIPEADVITPATTPTRVRRRGRHRREIVFGVVAALLAAGAIIWWATSSREPKPTFLVNPGPTAAVTPPTNVSGGPPPSNGPAVSGVTPPLPPVPNPPAGAASRSTLLGTYRAMHNVYQASHSYKAISLSTLGQLLPGVTIEDGAASSTNPHTVSLLVPASDRVVLAARDDAGCEWLRDFGAGAEISAQPQLVITCSAAAAPTTGWTGI